MLVGKCPPKGLQLEPGGQDIDEEDLTIDEELQKADPRLIMVHVIRLGIEGHLLDPINGLQERAERAGLVEKQVGRRTRGHFDPEQTAEA